MRINLILKTVIPMVWLTLLSAFVVGCTPATVSTPTPTPTPTQTSTNQEPIEILSVSGPLQPINPGGPIVEITLQNTGTESVVSLAATLELTRSFNFSFDVTSSNPLQSGKSISSKLTLIGGGFGDNTQYPLTISGTLENGTTFNYTKQVQIAAPAK